VKILSIDLDFISGPAINEFYTSGMYDVPVDDQPVVKWKKYQSTMPEVFENISQKIDIDNYDFCLRTFLRALKNCKDVHFGYDHDAILYGLEGHTDIEVVNIDHHSDILTNRMETEQELKTIDEDERVVEGNWGYYLQSQGRLKSFHWIMNLTSEEFTDTMHGHHLFGDKFSWSFKEDYDFGKYKFDQIFVCLSPGYIPPLHWHMLGTFIRVYEELYNKKINIDYLHRKYEMKKYYSGVTKIIY
tara:strand:- start:222 stop:953 length:732 start_codon:yes stop_codon:yes gene_type:complete